MSNPLDNLEPEKKDNVKENVSLELSDTQKLAILKAWENNYDNPPSIEELCDIAWPGKGFKGIHKEGRIIKKFLTEHDLTPKTKTVYEKKATIELTNEQKEYIEKNGANMKNHEIAQIIFERNFLTATSMESKAVGIYKEELRKQGVIRFDANNEEITDKYTAPNTFDRCCARINKYVDNSNFNFKTLSAQQKKSCQSLMSYLNSYTFNHQANSYSMTEDRDLFESVFISYCYDKPDLTREEVDKMIIIATEKVIAANKLKNIELLQTEQKRQLQEENKIALNIIEAINVQNQEYNGSVKRQQSLYNDLTEKRSERLKGKLKETASVLNLIELWKFEETRNKMIKIANQRKEKLKEEIDRLSNMDDLIGIIAGLDKSEVLNG